MTDETHAFIRRIRSYAHEHGARILLEVHGHYRQQIDLASAVDLVYDFALPPLVLHALHARDARPFARWLAIRPANAVTVLDTHDGIGIVDVGTHPLLPGVNGLLDSDEIDALVESVHRASGGTSRLATSATASNLDLYQVNCTFYGAVGGDDRSYLLARLLQLFLPGTPQIYYVGLLAGHNDVDLLQRTGVGRDVNRHHYRPDEIGQRLRLPVVVALLAAIRLRAHHPAFQGSFNHDCDDMTIDLHWRHGTARAALHLDLRDLTHWINSEIDGVVHTVDDVLALPNLGERWPA
jgi:sucrose phosphorylase